MELPTAQQQLKIWAVYSLAVSVDTPFFQVCQSSSQWLIYSPQSWRETFRWHNADRVALWRKRSFPGGADGYVSSQIVLWGNEGRQGGVCCCGEAHRVGGFTFRGNLSKSKLCLCLEAKVSGYNCGCCCHISCQGTDGAHGCLIWLVLLCDTLKKYLCLLVWKLCGNFFMSKRHLQTREVM